MTTITRYRPRPVAAMQADQGGAWVRYEDVEHLLREKEAPAEDEHDPRLLQLADDGCPHA